MSEASASYNGPGLADVGDALLFGADNGALGGASSATYDGPGIMGALDAVFEAEAG